MISPSSDDSLCSDCVSKKKNKKVIIHYYIKKKRKVQHSSRNNTFLELLDVIKKRVKCPSQLSFFGRFATFQKKAIKKGPKNSLSPTKSSTNGTPQPQLYIRWFLRGFFLGVLRLAISFYERKNTLDHPWFQPLSLTPDVIGYPPGNDHISPKNGILKMIFLFPRCLEGSHPNPFFYPTSCSASESSTTMSPDLVHSASSCFSLGFSGEKNISRLEKKSTQLEGLKYRTIFFFCKLPPPFFFSVTYIIVLFSISWSIFLKPSFHFHSFRRFLFPGAQPSSAKHVLWYQAIVPVLKWGTVQSKKNGSLLSIEILVDK